MTSGNAELIAVIRDEINQAGPISFARFMEQALYHPEHGFYASGRATLGRGGDYFTNVSVGPAFGHLLASQFIEICEALEDRDEIVIVEQGAHHGDLARDIFQWIAHERTDLSERIRYRIVEPSPVLEQRQRTALTDFGEKTEWFDSLDRLPPFRGVFFSNELLDAFPIHLISRRADWLEKRVHWKEHNFVFVDQVINDAVLRREVDKLPRVPPPFETEIALDIIPWVRSVSSRLLQGVILTIDYGLERRERYSEARREGTLQVRRSHRLLASPFVDVGQADITSHVDWDLLTEAAVDCGLQPVGMTDQHHFLAGILSVSPGLLEKASPKIRRELQTLLHPEMLGRSFQVLMIGRDLPAGLRPGGLRFSGRRMKP